MSKPHNYKQAITIGKFFIENSVYEDIFQVQSIYHHLQYKGLHYKEYVPTPKFYVNNLLTRNM